MKYSIRSTVTFLVTVTLLGSIAATTLLQQQASAVIAIIKQIDDFQRMTADLQKAVIKEGPAPHLNEDFTKLTAQLKRDVINAAHDDDASAICGIIVDYHVAALRIFADGPDSIPPLLDEYSRNVMELFECPSTSP